MYLIVQQILLIAKENSFKCYSFHILVILSFERVDVKPESAIVGIPTEISVKLWDARRRFIFGECDLKFVLIKLFK